MRRVSMTLVLFLAACGGGDKAALPVTEAAPPVAVRVEVPKDQPGAAVVRATGTLRAKHDAVLSAPATGTLARVFVEIGGNVKKGQALAALDTSTAEIMVEQATAAKAMAQAGLDAATVELDRAKQLRANEAAPPAVLDRANAAFHQASAGVAQATAALKAAEENLRDHTLRAPFDGVVTQRFKNIGETVAMMPPTPVIALVDAGNLEVRVPVPESVADLLEVGSVAKGTVSPSQKPLEVKVTSVGAVVEAQTRAVEVVAVVTSPITKEMRPGALVELDFAASAGQAAQQAGLYLPAQAVRSEGDRRFVFVVKDGVVEQRDVKTEPVSSSVVRVREGVQREEQVVVEGAAGLKAGARVKASS